MPRPTRQSRTKKPKPRKGNGRSVQKRPKKAPKEERLLGIYKASPKGGGHVLAIDKRLAGREFFIPPRYNDGACDGELVALETVDKKTFQVRERLGFVEKDFSRISIVAHGLQEDFSKDALIEAERARPATLSHREDWRHIPFITIDPVDAKDHDDAVYAKALPDGGFVIFVAIADVAHYVKPGSALDREALQRGNSVYFPDRVVPMLPERISNHLCSLKPDEDRAALAVALHIDAQGHKTQHQFHRILMRSAAKLAYEQAQPEGLLAPLFAAYRALEREREQRAPLDLDLPERKLILDDHGRLLHVLWPERLEAHRLIEAFMVLANVAAAETLAAAHSLFLYRAHDTPDVETLKSLAPLLASLGHKFVTPKSLKPAFFNAILKQVKGLPHEAIVHDWILRAQAKAIYTPRHQGHFGLNLPLYTHFTSPIRRYADLVVHRALIAALNLAPDGARDTPDLDDVAERISGYERRAMVAERDTADRLLARHHAQHKGKRFAARIRGILRVGLFVRLMDTGAEGFVPARSLRAYHYVYDEPSHAFISIRGGTKLRIGDRVEVELREAAPFAGALTFAIVLQTQDKPKPAQRHHAKGAGRKARSARSSKAFTK